MPLSRQAARRWWIEFEFYAVLRLELVTLTSHNHEATRSRRRPCLRRPPPSVTIFYPRTLHATSRRYVTLRSCVPRAQCQTSHLALAHTNHMCHIPQLARTRTDLPIGSVMLSCHSRRRTTRGTWLDEGLASNAHLANCRVGRRHFMDGNHCVARPLSS